MVDDRISVKCEHRCGTRPTEDVNRRRDRQIVDCGDREKVVPLVAKTSVLAPDGSPRCDCPEEGGRKTREIKRVYAGERRHPNEHKNESDCIALAAVTERGEAAKIRGEMGRA